VEIANGSATDCDGNGVLDECELGPRLLLYVDLNNARCQNGTSTSPYRTIEKATSVAAAGATVRIHLGGYAEKLTLFKAMRLEPIGGSVVVGR